MEGVERQRRGGVRGNKNGKEDDVWNPETDPELPSHFNRNDLSGKRECKRRLLEEFSLPIDLDRPILASISRLTAQKGIDLMTAVAGDVLTTGAYIISLGSGEKKYEEF